MLQPAINTSANEGTIDLGMIIINDVDGANNLTSGIFFPTDYGNVLIIAETGTPEIDGRYNVSLISNQDFDDLTINDMCRFDVNNSGWDNFKLDARFC